MKPINPQTISELLQNLKQTKPLVHHITNYVTVNDCANVTLAIGASPVMADDIDEVRDIVTIAQSLVINMGTLNARTIVSMLAAGKKANELGKPIIFDPVGAGASALRNETAHKLISEVKFAVIRGNLSEILFLAGLSANTKGVDVSDTDLQQSGTDTALQTAKSLAVKLGCVIAITGATDIISDGTQTVSIENGHKMLGSITGTGCMCSSLVGSAIGATTDYFLGACAGVLFMGLAGELAFEKVGQLGSGSLHISLIDQIYNLNADIIQKRAKMC